MDFRLKVFLSVADNLSYTKASRQLQISQPAVTRHIQELEGQYNVQLFSRQGTGIVLTPAGELFRERAAVILKGYDMLQYEMELAVAPFQGELKVAVEAPLATKVTQMLPAFIGKFPEVEIRFITGNKASVMESLHNGAADMAFMECAPQGGEFVCCNLQECSLGLLVSVEDEKKQTRQQALATFVKMYSKG